MSFKIYTKTGDDGETGLVGGYRVEKSHPRINAYGTVDELNCSLGTVIALLHSDEPSEEKVKEQLSTIQHRLFNIGSILACPSTNLDQVPEFRDQWIADLEEWMDIWTKILPDLTNFILPGGSLVACHAHNARAICRRAERLTADIIKEPGVTGPFRFLNRLSDYLFVLARYCNQLHGYDDIKWQK